MDITTGLRSTNESSVIFGLGIVILRMEFIKVYFSSKQSFECESDPFREGAF